MTNEISFSQDHGSLWSVLLPGCDLFVRRLNLDLCQIIFNPMIDSVVPYRRGLINEIAFSLYSEHEACRSDPFGFDFSVGGIKQTIDAARTFIAGIEYIDENTIRKLSEFEMIDVREQISRLTRHISGSEIFYRPVFSGCGIIDRCHGDVLCDGILYEIKAGDRLFRSIDIRQLLIYIMLDLYNGDRRITSVSLFNPRLGIAYVSTIVDFVYQASGKTLHVLAEELLSVISSGGISR